MSPKETDLDAFDAEFEGIVSLASSLINDFKVDYPTLLGGTTQYSFERGALFSMYYGTPCWRLATWLAKFETENISGTMKSLGPFLLTFLSQIVNKARNQEVMASQNWNTGQQIRDHQLVTSIINGHGDSVNEVLNPSDMSVLQRFCTNPTTTTRDKLLHRYGWTDVPGRAAGTKAAESGRLAAYLVARHGGNDHALDDADIGKLKEWFEKGMPKGEHGTE